MRSCLKPEGLLIKLVVNLDRFFVAVVVIVKRSCGGTCPPENDVVPMCIFVGPPGSALQACGAVIPERQRAPVIYQKGVQNTGKLFLLVSFWLQGVQIKSNVTPAINSAARWEIMEKMSVSCPLL